MKPILFVIAILVSVSSLAQQNDALIYFTDKPNVADALANPITILSQKSLDRKALHNILIDERDVPVNETYKAAIAARSGITVLAKSKWLNAVYVRGSISAINSLANLSYVREIEFLDRSLNRRFQPKPLRDKFEVETEHRTNYNYGYAGNQVEMIQVNALHEENYDGQGITIAFMDNGYPNVLQNRAYLQMRNQGRLLGYYDFVDRTENPRGTGSHGAATLSTAAAFIDGEYVGTAPKASYYLFITEDGRQESPVEEAWWVEALERADSLGVFVTNTSLGYLDFDVPAYNYQYADLDGHTTLGARGSNIAFEKGMLNVVSAGNEGSRFGYITSPADALGSFTVGAVDSDGTRAWFSSHGPAYDGRIKPDVMAQGESAAIINEYGSVSFSNGTSFSGPIIAGAVASLWQAAPHLKNNVIMQIIRESSSLYSSPTDEMGYGIPDFGDALARVEQLGIEVQMQQQLFAIYPNPVESRFFVSFPNNKTVAQLALYNILGQKLMQQQISPTANSVDISSLNSGVYLVSITSENKTTSFKIIKK